MRKRFYIFIAFVVFVTLTIIVVAIFRLSPVKTFTEGVEIALTPIRRIFAPLRIPSEQRIDEKKIESVTEQTKRRQVDADAKALRDQFAISNPSPLDLVPARIIGMKGFVPGVSVPEVIIIDQGENQGIKKGSAVVYKDILLGQVKKTTATLSEIETIQTKNMSFTAQTSATSAPGIVKFGDTGLLLTNVVLSDSLKKGDSVITKGNVNLDGTGIPPNLVVGRIVSVSKKASDLFQTASLEPLVDITDLTLVFVAVSN